MRLKAAFAACAALLGAPIALAHRPAAPVPSPLSVAAAHARGAVHVHTAASGDGRGDLDGVARAAARAGLDFVVLTEHAGELPRLGDGYRHGVLVLVGLEKSTDGGHALALGLRSLPFRLDGDPAAVARDVADYGGFLVAAHPRTPTTQGGWSAGLEGVSGVEVLNLADRAAWPSGPALLPHLLRYPFDPQGTLLRALRVPPDALQLWDGERFARPLAGLLGSDAHGGLLSHLAIFRLASQHLLLERPLTGQVDHDGALVLQALRRGRGWIAIDALADASRFVFEARGGGRVATPGGALALEGPVELAADAAAPAGSELVLLRDGEAVARGGPPLRHLTQRPGTYRVEGYLARELVPGAFKPWILSNPIDVYPAGELEQREARAAALPSLDAPLTAQGELLDDFAEARLSERWQLDRARDARAAMTLAEGVLRFDFALGAGPRSHASLCDWGPRDLSGHSALLFTVRADRPFRFDVQVHVADGAAPGGVRIWRRSVRAGSGWRRVAVPFAALETYDGLGGRPDRSQVRGVYFHVDEAHLAPGSSGTLWFDDYGTGR
jgi:hypothetical protein